MKMRAAWPSRLLCALTTAVLLSACRPDSGPIATLLAPSTQAPAIVYVTATPAALSDAPQIAGVEEPCSHLLWPLTAGASWTYRLITTTGEEQIALTATPGSTGAVFLDGSQQRELTCVDGALIGLPPLPIGHPDLGRDVTGVPTNGSLLAAPVDLLPLGQPAGWDLEVDASGSIRLPLADDASLPISSGQIAIVSQAEPLAEVTVPAGTYTALPVRQDVFYEIIVQLPDGTQQDVLISAAVVSYYAEAAGLVRVEYEGGTVSTASGAWPLEPGPVLELMAVSLP